MNKIILLGLRDLATDENLESQTDYGVFLVAQRVSEEKEDQDSDDEPVIKYRLRIDHIDSITKLGQTKEIKFEKGRSPSEKQRFVIINELGVDEYEPFMNWLLLKIPGLAEEYRDK
jgi:hypothetical protein